VTSALCFLAGGSDVALTAKEQKFAEEYVRCLNASEAARRAGYDAKYARQIGSENLTKLDIRAEIERLLEEVAMSPGEVVARLSDQARGDMGDYLKPGRGSSVAVDLKAALDAGLMRRAKKIKIGRVTVELYDSQRALAKLADIWGLVRTESDDGTDPESDEEAILEAARAIERKRSEQGIGGVTTATAAGTLDTVSGTAEGGV
jgi:phage terminase small subunit